MMPVRTNQQQGYILISVILAIALISSIAFMLNQEGVINTRLVADEAQSDEAHYVAEAALNHAKWQLNTMDCTGYTDIPNTPFGQNSYSATISPSNGSPVTVNATGQLANGVTQTIAFADTRVFATTPITVTLQPDSTSGKDTYLRSDNPNTNYGGSNDIHAEQGRRNSLIEFDLSTIPVDATITSATLELFLTNDGANPVQVDIHSVTRSWVEGTRTGSGTANGATWNRYDGTNNWTTAGGDYAAAAAASTIVPTGNNTWHQWDITTLVSDWLTNTTPNYGLMLRQAGARDRVQFASSENATVTRHPKLTISYLGECGASSGPPGSTTDTFQPTADTYINNQNASTRNLNYGGANIIRVGQSNRYRTLIRFDDVSTIAPLSVISSAKLRFYVVANAGSADINIDINPITRSWVEGTRTGTGSADGATWNTYNGTNSWTTAGGDYDPASTDVLIAPNGDTNIWIEVDITALAQEWVDLIRPNHGVILRSSGARIDMSSRESTTNKPELVITYTP